MRRPSAPRRGFTLIEMLISISLLLSIFAIAVPFFRVQARAVDQHAGRLDARTNARYAINAIDRDLRVAGIGLPSGQPLLVQASPTAVTFNVDLVSRTAADFEAVYINPDADTLVTPSLTRARRVTLPTSSVAYPDTTYLRDSGVQSYAETVSYWVEPDTSAGGAGRHVMLRRINDAPPRVVARGLVVTPDRPVFRYFFVDSATGRLAEVPTASLPIYHRVPIHNDPADRGAARLIDTIRVVRVRLAGAYTDPRTARTDTLIAETSIRMLNAGLIRRPTCGVGPVFTSAVSVTPLADPSRIQVSWPASTDETGGDQDVVRYAIYRRPAAATTWSEPFATVPTVPGTATYDFVDSDVRPGERWIYGVAAEDCNPLFSPIVGADSIVTVP